MKRIGNLINTERVTVDLCKQAIIDASKGKMKRRAVRRVNAHIEKYAEDVQKLVLDGTFKTSPYTYKIKVEYGKERHLQQPKFYPDQVVHHIMILLIKDKTIKRIDPYAIASIDGRGIHYGLKKIKYWVQKEKHCRTNAKYCFKGDIRKCFDSIKPSVAMSVYEHMIKDEKYLALMRKIIYSSDSLPLGNYISAFTLNLMLKPMDDRIRSLDCTKHYLRYMDDFIVLGANKRKMKQLDKVAKEELSKLQLNLKENYQLFKVEDRGVDIIGYRVFRNKTLLRRRNFKRIIKNVKRISSCKIYSVHDCCSIISMLAQAKYSGSNYLYKNVGRMLNIPLVKHIIGENARKKMKGFSYIPDVVLR